MSPRKAEDHGDADQHVPLSGGASPLSGRDGRSYLSLEEAARFWNGANACSDPPQIESLRNGSVRRRSWAECASGRHVEVVEIEGWGHQWPGLYFTRQLPEADPLHNFDGTSLIWNFFQRQPSPP